MSDHNEKLFDGLILQANFLLPEFTCDQLVQHFIPPLPDESFTMLKGRIRQGAAKAFLGISDNQQVTFETIFSTAICKIGTALTYDLVLFIDPTGLLHQGENALHALLSPGAFSTFQQRAFKLFNEHGIESAQLPGVKSNDSNRAGATLVAFAGIVSTALSADLGIDIPKTSLLPKLEANEATFDSLALYQNAPLLNGRPEVFTTKGIAAGKASTAKSAFGTFVYCLLNAEGGVAQGISDIFFPLTYSEISSGGRSSYQYSRYLNGFSNRDLTWRFLESHGIPHSKDEQVDTRAIENNIETVLRNAYQLKYILTSRTKKRPGSMEKRTQIYRCGNALKLVINDSQFYDVMKETAYQMANHPWLDSSSYDGSMLLKNIGVLVAQTKATEELDAERADGHISIDSRIKIVSYLAFCAICGFKEANSKSFMNGTRESTPLCARNPEASCSEKGRLTLVELYENSGEKFTRRHSVTAELPNLLSPELDQKQHCFSIGRSSDCDVKLDDIGVSRHHATLTYHNGIWQLEDRGSTNGTMVKRSEGAWINAKKDEAIALTMGDVIVFAPGEGQNAPSQADGNWYAVTEIV